MFENQDRLWVIHISGKGKRVVARAQDEGFVCIGWTKIGDLHPHDTPDKLKAAFGRAFPNKSAASVRSSYGQVFRFAHEVQIGEPIVYPIKGSRDILIGKVTGPYEWSPDPELREGDCCNVRRVEWLARVPRVRFSQQALHSFGSFSTLSSADEFLEEVRAVLAGKQLADEAPEQPDPVEEEETTESEETAVSAAEEVLQATKDYLIRRWSRTHQDFEEVVAAVFRAMGYTATVQQGSRDLGVDVVAHADPLGVTPPILKIQAKSGTSSAGAPVVKQLRGVLNSGEKGVVISRGGFSVDARHPEQNDANRILNAAERFVDLFLDSYENLSPEMRHRYPLKRVYVASP